MNILKNNALLGTFMGLLESSIKGKYWTETNHEGIGHGKLVELEYHTSFDWLMPVVDKIKRTDLSSEMVGNGLAEMIDEIDDALKSGFVLCVYEEVVTFIKAYNEHTK